MVYHGVNCVEYKPCRPERRRYATPTRTPNVCLSDERFIF